MLSATEAGGLPMSLSRAKELAFEKVRDLWVAIPTPLTRYRGCDFLEHHQSV